MSRYTLKMSSSSLIQQFTATTFARTCGNLELEGRLLKIEGEPPSTEGELKYNLEIQTTFLKK